MCVQGEVGPSTERAVTGSVDLAAILNELRFGVVSAFHPERPRGLARRRRRNQSGSGNGANARSMEVMSVRDQRSGLVEEIIALRDRGAPGSSRLSVCQLCGELAATGGLGGGLVLQAAGEFVATGHDHGAVGELRALLRASPQRWCAWCQAPIRVDMRGGAGDELNFGDVRMCAGCRAAGRAALIGRESQARHLRTLSSRQLRDQRDRAERAVALAGTARSSELATVRLALRRARRRLHQLVRTQ